MRVDAVWASHLRRCLCDALRLFNTHGAASTRDALPSTALPLLMRRHCSTYHFGRQPATYLWQTSHRSMFFQQLLDLSSHTMAFGAVCISLAPALRFAPCVVRRKSAASLMDLSVATAGLRLELWTLTEALISKPSTCKYFFLLKKWVGGSFLFFYLNLLYPRPPSSTLAAASYRHPRFTTGMRCRVYSCNNHTHTTGMPRDTHALWVRCAVLKLGVM